MQFDFTLSMNGAQTMNVRGNFFKLVSATGKVKVTTNTGESIELLPGQGVNNVNFEWLVVKDRTGANNVGTLLAGNFAFTDDRVAGQVEVIDGERVRTLAGLMFAASPYCVAVANQYSNIQLWNPSDSGKNLVVGAMDFGTTTNGAINVMASNIMLANVFAVPVGNKLMGKPPGKGQVRTETRAAADPFTYGSMRNEATAANAPQQWNIRGAVVVPPGWGLNVYCPNTAITTTANFEWFEEQI